MSSISITKSYTNSTGKVAQAAAAFSLLEALESYFTLDPTLPIIKSKYNIVSEKGVGCYGLGLGGSGGGGLNLFDGLTNQTPGMALDSRQGYLLDQKILGKADSGHEHSWTGITNKPLSFAPSAHSHTWDSVTDKPLSFAPSAHSHTWDSVTDKPSAFAPSAHSHSWDSIQDKPSAFAPSAHNHAISSVTGLSDALSGKEASLGNPTVDGQIIASTMGGVRSWVNRYVLPVAAAAVLGGVMVGTGLNASAQGLLAHSDFSIETGIGGTLGHIKSSERSGWNSHVADTSSHLSIDERAYFNKLKTYFLFASDNSSVHTPIVFYSDLGVGSYGLGSGGSGGGGSVNVIDNLISTSTIEALSANMGRYLSNLISSKSDTGHSHAWDSITSKPVTFTPAAHSHDWTAIVSGKPTTLSGYGITDAAALAHAHDTRYQRAYAGGGTIDANSINEFSSINEYRWTNTPINSIGLLYTNNNYASNWFTQDFYSITTQQRWFRNYNGGNVAFSSWFEFYHSGNISTIKTDLGLGSAAYTASTAYDLAGAASTVQGNLNTHAGLTTTAHGLGASAFHADSYFALLAGSTSQAFSASSLTMSGALSGTTEVSCSGSILGLLHQSAGGYGFETLRSGNDYGWRIYANGINQLIFSTGALANTKATTWLTIVDSSGAAIFASTVKSKGFYVSNLTAYGNNGSPYYSTVLESLDYPTFAIKSGNSGQSDHATYLKFTVNSRGVEFTPVNALILAPDYAIFNSIIQATNATFTSLGTGYLPYKTSGAFANSPIWTDGAKVGITTITPFAGLTIGQREIYGAELGFEENTNSSSKAWKFASDRIVFGDFAIQSSVGHGVSTGLSIVAYISPSGNIDIGYGGGQSAKFAVNGSIYSASTLGSANVIQSGYQVGHYSTGRAEISMISITDIPCDFWLGNASTRQWSIGCRGSGESNVLSFYSVTAGHTMRLWHSGNLGLGYAAEQSSKLAVNGSIYSASSIIAETSVKIGNWEFIKNGDSELLIKLSGALKAKVDSSGNILAMAGVGCYAL